jgi:predicted permease
VSAPRWARSLLTRLADPERADEVVGDLEEAHARRRRRHSGPVAALITTFEALDLAVALLRARRRRRSRADASFAARTGWLSSLSWLDVKLSVRMLLKHPGLSTVSWIGMTFGVTVGACAFGVIHGLTSSTLPLEEGDRIVTVQNAFELGFEPARSTHLHALGLWRTQTSAFEELAAYRVATRNLITAEGTVAPERVVEMTASGFRIARVPPLLGRHLHDADEAEGGPAVAVIGHGVWRDRFGEAPDVIGRTLQIGATPHIVVGVMPQGFAFPIADRVWTPLRLNPVEYEIAQAPGIEVFARLASGVSIDLATTQVRGITQRAAEVLADTRGTMRTQVFSYTRATLGESMAWVLYIVQVVVSLILVVIAINVSVLVYARTVARAREISVRAALGASRRRIVTQLFVEAFLLSGLAAVSGLIAATFVLDRVELSILSREGAPFWWDFGLTPGALAYGFVLAVVAAVIVGIVPALGATGRRLGRRLQAAGAGLSTPRLGRTWTALIVLQIAAAVAILPVSLSSVARYATQSIPDASYPLDELLTARVQLDEGPATVPSNADPDAWQRRYDERLAELTRRLEARSEIEAVAFMGMPPWLDPDLPFEMDGATADPLTGAAMRSASTGHAVGRSTVSPALFDVVDLPVLSGRRLSAGDAVEGSRSIVVNQRLEELVLGGASAVGRSIRFPTYSNPALGDRSELEGAGQPWYTIVGVVPTFPPPYGIAKPEAKAYLPLLPGHDGPQTMLLRIRATEAGQFAGQLRRLVADVDPQLRLERVETIEAMTQRENVETPMFLATVVGLSTSILLLAIAGLYAMMSFTVARQHREIGIRIALGARPARVLGGILFRAAWQLAVGVGVGLLFAGVFDRLLGGETLGGQEAYLLPAVAMLMAGVGVLAAWAPAREGLSVQPIEALRAE